MTRLRSSSFAGHGPSGNSPMSLAEAAECCGQYRWDAAVDDTRVHYCANCPLLIEPKREVFLRQMRAL